MSYADYLKSKGLSLSGADNETPAQAAKQVNQPSGGGFNTGQTYGWVDSSGNAMKGQGLDPVLNLGSFLFNNAAQGYDVIRKSIENQNLASQTSPEDYWGLNAELGYEFNPDPELVKKNQKKIDQNNDAIAAQKEANSQMLSDFTSGNYDRKKDYSEKAKAISNTDTEEYAINGVKKPIDTTASNNALYGRDDTELTDKQAFDRWYAQKQLDNPDLTYDSFEDFQFNGSANDWLDFMLDADTWAPGMYTDYLQNSLGDSYGFNREDAEALAAAQALYSDYVTDWRSNHTAAGLLNDSQIAAEILGGYYNNDAQYNALIDYLANMYPTGNYTDANGQMYYDFANLDDNSRAMLNQMFANSSLQGLLGSNISESQLDALGSLYDQYDYALADNGTYTAAGMDPYRDELQSYVATANLMDPSLYLAANGSPSQGAMSQLVLADALGYGSNQNFTEEQWKNAFGL